VRQFPQEFAVTLHVQAQGLFGPLHVARERRHLLVEFTCLQQPHQRDHRHDEHAHGRIGHHPLPALAGLRGHAVGADRRHRIAGEWGG
jgi:hypothetical protein